MQSLDLVEHDLPNQSQIHLLKPQELFYLRLKSALNLGSELEDFIKKACSYSSYVILSIPIEEYHDQATRDQLYSLGIKGVALRCAHSSEKWLRHQGAGQFFAGDRDIIDQVKGFIRIKDPEKELTVEFQVGDDVRILAPTITGLYEEGVSWVVVNPLGHITNFKCTQMREVFEYLKIRSCTRLNVYFSFWKVDAREWDMKSQNTFSGLEYVHIDISNRCTHSCVFCGLYGPDSIEEMKKKGGGKISEDINKMMKMEIDSEKCFNIINSLPWSVRAIQFGGFGDPLMHESAVEFIAMARSRGFSVEVLSNMEYLDENDIKKLDALGGPALFDLHFIANISAGTPELYVKTRPRQTEAHFQKIVNNIKLFSKLKALNNGSGAHFTLMCVVNKLNCLNLLDVARLAKEIGAARLWMKPIEIHAEIHKLQLPSADMMKGMANSLKEAIAFAEENNIEIFQKEFCDKIIQQYSGETINV